ncbi:MAG: hypothetical protein V4732_16470 [Pseudomonadota bacterium]
MMKRRRGWGSLLLIALPLLLWLVWAQLGAQTATISFDRFDGWYRSEMSKFSKPLSQFFHKNKRPAGPGDVTLPAVPQNSGIKSWAIQPDTTVLIELDAKIGGRAVQLRLVPIVESAKSFSYDCISETIHVKNNCHGFDVRSIDGIPAQLAKNTQMISTFPDIVTSSGDKLAPGTQVGSVLVVPDDLAKLDHCGYQCVKIQNCKKSRVLACSKTMTEGNSRWYEIISSNTRIRGEDIATLADANKICEQSLGVGVDARVLRGSGITGVIKLDVTTEYWVHDDIATHNNCWELN